MSRTSKGRTAGFAGGLLILMLVQMPNSGSTDNAGIILAQQQRIPDLPPTPGPYPTPTLPPPRDPPPLPGLPPTPGPYPTPTLPPPK
jgi:hypothetical protein